MRVPKPTTCHDPKFLAYVRTLPCFFHPDGGCRDWTTIGKGVSEAAHLWGKSRDDLVIPLSGKCHRTGTPSWHSGEETFMKHHHTTKARLIVAASRLYREWKQ